MLLKGRQDSSGRMSRRPGPDTGLPYGHSSSSVALLAAVRRRPMPLQSLLADLRVYLHCWQLPLLLVCRYAVQLACSRPRAEPARRRAAGCTGPERAGTPVDTAAASCRLSHQPQMTAMGPSDCRRRDWPPHRLADALRGAVLALRKQPCWLHFPRTQSCRSAWSFKGPCRQRGRGGYMHAFEKDQATGSSLTRPARGVFTLPIARTRLRLQSVCWSCLRFFSSSS